MTEEDGSTQRSLTAAADASSRFSALLPPTRRRAVLGVAIAVVGPALVALAGRPDGSPIDTFPGTFVLSAVILAALVGHMLIGLLAAFVGSVALAVGFVGTDGELTLTGDSIGALLGFAAVAVLVSLLLAARDVAREDAESSMRRYRALVEQLPDVTYSARFEDDRLVYVSPQVQALLGVSSEAALAEPRFWEQHVDPDDRARFLAEWDAWRAREMREPFRGEYCMVHSDGGRVWVADTAVLVRDAGGSPNHFQGSVRNESRRHQLEAQLRQSQKLEAVGTLAGGIAHDFNNLLAIVGGYARLLIREAADEQNRAWANEIAQAAERGASLVRQLLTFSRRRVLTLSPLDLNAMLLGVDRLLRRLIGADVELVLELDPEVPVISADRVQMEQVVLNLALNARDAMPAGGTLRIETAAADLAEPPGDLPAGAYAVLTVSDTGAGIDAETQPRIFEPFFTTKPEGKGSGLGLATVYGVVVQSGGAISVDSAPGRGATFRLYFPATAAPAVTVPPAGPVAVPGGTETILLVEDDATLRELSRLLLTEAGYTVLTAEDGAAALALAREERPIDLLVTDVVMPVMNGPELAERLRAIQPDIRVVYVSGYQDRALAGRGIGPDDAVVGKPFAEDELRREVRRALERP